MSAQRLKALVDIAIEQGILPAGAVAPEDQSRPWPVVLMTGLGAWLAAIPLFAVMFLIFGDAVEKGAMTYVLGAGILAGAVSIFRRPGVSVFVEQLGVPSLLVGGGLLAFGFTRDLPETAGWSLDTVVICLVAALVPRSWLRVLLGALACGTFMMAGAGYHRYAFGGAWTSAHVAVLIAVLAIAWCSAAVATGTGARRLAALESVATGWLLFGLFSLALASGTTFLAGASLEYWGGRHAGTTPMIVHIQQFLSIAMAFAGAAWLLARWPALLTAWAICAAAILVALAWMVPTLGAALLVLAICLAGSRWRLAVASAITAAWIIGTFYYQLAFPLATKAIIMTGAGAALGVLAWIGWSRTTPEAGATQAPAIGTWQQQAAIAVSLVAVLAVANVAIWQKQDLILHGRPVFIELAPVDPRSLMQGDYMRLNFNIANIDRNELADRARTMVVARVNTRGITTIERIDSGQPIGADEIRIELLRTASGLRPATDAWYFKEGDGDRWAKARFGEFRIDSHGRALLVDLRGPDLEKL